jgi:hypothetical protein
MGTYYDRKHLRLTKPYDSIVDGLTELIRTQKPDAVIKFTDCGHCRQLHMLIFLDEPEVGDQPEISLSIEYEAWQPLS